MFVAYSTPKLTLSSKIKAQFFSVFFNFIISTTFFRIYKYLLHYIFFFLCRCEPGLHPRLRWQRSIINNKRIASSEGRLKYFKNLNIPFNKLKSVRKLLIEKITMHSEKRRKRDVHGDEKHSVKKTRVNAGDPKSKRALLMGHQTQQRQQQLMNRRKDGSRHDSKKKNRGGGGMDYDGETDEGDGDGNGNGNDNGNSNINVDGEEDKGGGASLNKLKSGRGKGMNLGDD